MNGVSCNSVFKLRAMTKCRLIIAKLDSVEVLDANCIDSWTYRFSP